MLLRWYASRMSSGSLVRRIINSGVNTAIDHLWLLLFGGIVAIAITVYGAIQSLDPKAVAFFGGCATTLFLVVVFIAALAPGRTRREHLLKRAAKTTEATSGPISMRITRAVAGTIPQGLLQRVFLLLKIRASISEEPSVTVRRWSLSLTKADGQRYLHFASGYDPPSNLSWNKEARFLRQVVPDERIDVRLDVRLSSEPLRPGIGAEGWVAFGINHDVLCHLFGLTITIEAEDDFGRHSSLTQFPGEWLEPVRFMPPSD